MTRIEKFTPVSFLPPTIAEEDGTGSPHVVIVLSDAGGSKLMLTISPEVSWELSEALKPTDNRRLLVELYADIPKQPNRI